MSKKSRLLVVDASVMRSAGNLASEGHSGASSQILQRIELICHRVATTSEIREEWNRHQSTFAKSWRARMIAKRKLLSVTADQATLETVIKEKVPAQNTAERRELLKDAHLLAAAQAADRVLLTADSALHALCTKHAILKDLIEWMELLPENTATQNEILQNRLVDLTTNHPNPPLPP